MFGAEVNLDNTYIRAPFDGTVLSKNADVGEIVAPLALLLPRRIGGNTGGYLRLKSRPTCRVKLIGFKLDCHAGVLDTYPTVRYQGAVKNCADC